MKTFINYCETEKINEGLFSWLWDLIKSLFKDDDDISISTEINGKSASKLLKTLPTKKPSLTVKPPTSSNKKPSNNDIQEETSKILKEKTYTEFIKHLKLYADDLMKSDLYDEETVIRWELITLYMGLMVAKDKDDTERVKALTKEYTELKQKYPEVEKTVIQDINTDNLEFNNLNKSKISEQTKSIYMDHKDYIESILNDNNIEINIDDVINTVNTLCIKNNIIDSNKYYGFILLRLGSLICDNKNIVDEAIK